MNDGMIGARSRRRILASPALPEPYLSRIGREHFTHGFLARAAQGCYQRQVRLLVEVFAAKGLSPGEVRVLDWGAGKGHIAYLLRQAGFDLVCCDVRAQASDSSFGQATPILAEQGIEVVPLDHPWRLPFADGHFDLVVSFGVLEHVPHEAQSLREIARVLKPQGLFFFCFLPYWLSWTQRLARLAGDHYHDRLYDIAGLNRLLAEAGLRLHDVWHGQLLPKNDAPYSTALERLDRLLTEYTPLKHLATNLEGFATPR